MIRFKTGEHKADVMTPYLDAAAASGRSQMAAIGCAQEYQQPASIRQAALPHARQHP